MWVKQTEVTAAAVSRQKERWLKTKLWKPPDIKEAGLLKRSQQNNQKQSNQTRRGRKMPITPSFKLKVKCFQSKQVKAKKQTLQNKGQLLPLFLKYAIGFSEVKMVLEISFKISGHHQKKKYVNNLRGQYLLLKG